MPESEGATDTGSHGGPIRHGGQSARAPEYQRVDRRAGDRTRGWIAVSAVQCPLGEETERGVFCWGTAECLFFPLGRQQRKSRAAQGKAPPVA